jgi:predicted flap endonuclease-1-like 5' DNA nuclease
VESVPAAEPAPPEPPAATTTTSAVAPEPPIAVELPITVEPPAVAPPPPPAPKAAPNVEPIAGSPDDLKRINGIGPALEKKLNACGVASFRDLATLSDADIERIEAVIKFAGRIRRENWIEQAKAHYLQKYGEPL